MKTDAEIVQEAATLFVCGGGTVDCLTPDHIHALDHYMQNSDIGSPAVHEAIRKSLGKTHKGVIDIFHSSLEIALESGRIEIPVHAGRENAKIQLLDISLLRKWALSAKAPMQAFPITFWKDNDVITAHSNMIIVNQRLRTIEHYEPHGDHASHLNKQQNSRLRTLITKLFEKLYPSYKYVPPSRTCPRVNLSLGVSVNEFGSKSKSDGPQMFVTERLLQGSCAIWSIWFLHVRILNPDVPASKCITKALRLITGEADKDKEPDYPTNKRDRNRCRDYSKKAGLCVNNRDEMEQNCPKWCQSGERVRRIQERITKFLHAYYAQLLSSLKIKLNGKVVRRGVQKLQYSIDGRRDNMDINTKKLGDGQIVFPSIQAITVYGKANCVDCKKARDLIEGNPTYHTVYIDIEGSRLEYDRYIAPAIPSSHKTLPVVFHGDQFIGGYNELVKYYKEWETHKMQDGPEPKKRPRVKFPKTPAMRFPAKKPAAKKPRKSLAKKPAAKKPIAKKTRRSKRPSQLKQSRLTVKELRARCKERGVKGYSKQSKAWLLKNC